MCITSSKTPFFSAVWGAPVRSDACVNIWKDAYHTCQMVFEVLVLASTVINALDRPTTAETPLTRALHRDGITYFFVRASPCPTTATTHSLTLADRPSHVSAR